MKPTHEITDAARPVFFLSYRRDDSADIAGRIYDRLTGRFGQKAVFKDVDSIKPGEDFPSVLAESLQGCKVVLVIIGKNWLKVTDKMGRRRLDDPADYVRREVEAGLKHVPWVLPVLVQGTDMPDEKDLPETLRSLARKHAANVRPDPDFKRDMRKLIADLQRLAAAEPDRPVLAPQFEGAGHGETVRLAAVHARSASGT